MKIRNLSEQCIESIEVLMQNHGWALTHIYGDGVANLSKDYNGEQVMVFVDKYGTIRPPRSHGTMIAGSELHPLLKERQRQTQWAIVVTWSEPEDGMAVYGPYTSEDQAKDDWPNVEPDLHNDDVLPPDVQVEYVVLDKPYLI